MAVTVDQLNANLTKNVHINKFLKKCVQPGSNRRPFACKANVITTTLCSLEYLIRQYKNVYQKEIEYFLHTMKSEIETILAEAFADKKVDNNITHVSLSKTVKISNILEFYYHDKSIVVAKDKNLKILCSDKNRFTHNVVCFTCNMPGHISKDCTNIEERRCQFCDQEHMNSSCPMFFCDKCYEFGHKFNSCRSYVNKSKCRSCKYKHDFVNCPKIWRTYSLFKNPTKNLIRTCHNCPDETTHLSGDCKFTDDAMLIFTKDWRSRCKIKLTDSNKPSEESSKNVKKTKKKNSLRK